MLEQKRNEVEIVGLLSETDIREGVSKKGRDYIGGTVTIKAEEIVNGKPVEVEVPISVFANKTTNAGAPNPAYESIKNIQSNYVSLASCGDSSQATYLRIWSKDAISENSWYDTKSNIMREGARIRASFFNEANRTTPSCAKFTEEIVILAKREEVDREGIPTGRLIIKGGVANYNHEIEVLTFYVENPEGVNYINTIYQEGQTAMVKGIIKYVVTQTVEQEQMAFGEPVERVRTTSKKELVITAGGEPYDEVNSFSDADVDEAMQNREKKLAQIKADAIGRATKGAPSAPPTASKYGF